MKKYIVPLLSLVLLLSFESCASKPAVDKSVDRSASSNKQSDVPANKRNKQEPEKLRFDDWKYKGFGQELPIWVESAVDSDNITLKNLLSEVYNVSTVTVIVGTGENSDQAEQSAKVLEAQLLSDDKDYKFYDSFWVRENISLQKIDMPYKAVYVYYKE